MGKKRNKFDIILDILQTIGNKGGTIKQTHLMYKANLSHTQMKGYLAELSKKKLLEEIQKEHNTFIFITEDGFKFLEKSKDIPEFEETFGL